MEGGYSLSLLLHMSSYRYAGRETREGVDCYRLDFGPGETRAPGSGLAWKVASVMQGTLWITVAGYHLAWAEAETTRRVPIALSLAKVREVRVSMESGPVGDGVWLPRRIEMLTRARVLIKSIHRRNLYTYSDFSRAAPRGPAGAALRLVPGHRLVVLRLGLLLQERHDARRLDFRDQRAVQADQARRAGGDEQHVAVAQEVLGTVAVEDGARIDLR